MSTNGSLSQHVRFSAVQESLGITCSTIGYAFLDTSKHGSGSSHSMDSDFGLRSSSVGQVPSEWMLTYVLSGRGSLEFRDAETHCFCHGSVTLVPPGKWYLYRIDPSEVFRAYYIAFDGFSLSERKVCTAIDELLPVASVGIHGHVIELFRELFEIADSCSDDVQRELGATIVLLVARLVNCLHERRRLNADFSDIDQAKAAIHFHSTDEISISDLARELHLPISTFRRHFRANVGISPYRYFQTCKVDAVKRELERGDLPLRTIAEKLGFTDQYHLSRVFKRITGVRPSQWRNRQQADSNVRVT